LDENGNFEEHVDEPEEAVWNEEEEAMCTGKDELESEVQGELEDENTADSIRNLLDRNRFEYEWPALSDPVYAETSEISPRRSKCPLHLLI